MNNKGDMFFTVGKFVLEQIPNLVVGMIVMVLMFSLFSSYVNREMKHQETMTISMVKGLSGCMKVDGVFYIKRKDSCTKNIDINNFAAKLTFDGKITYVNQRMYNDYGLCTYSNQKCYSYTAVDDSGKLLRIDGVLRYVKQGYK